MGSMTKDEINANLFDEVRQLRVRVTDLQECLNLREEISGASRAEISRLTTELAAEKELHTDRVCTLKKRLDELLARNEALEKVYEAAQNYKCYRDQDAAFKLFDAIDAVQRGEG